MTKAEFLEKLRAALGNDLTGSIIQENVSYYDQYISDEVRKGRSEEEVIAELGDPWVLAQTIIDTAGNGSGQKSSTYETKSRDYEGESSGSHRTSSGISWWKILLVVLGIIGIFAVVVTVVGGVVSFFAPILMPLLIIFLLYKMFSKRR